ncbi:aminoglycoside 6'-N-acetyltransferase [Stappia aggregata IAM 12614]|uniref:Aminoglycoside 6'-N-acetyltransferase n=1 Tax=Roseibium aggregatum (strain ATCC 25650 / DSM 13394 / JCM 20685 / NBRC 16684 / NCIMB 2208 / IAM 12614 / B1) TaxID=384765 RepID=A0NUI0_ROSAI|nr:GNAT family N-acetyltransferase [Roseibium aggregatum]EAV43582.1 aminoglycoside 6'-N-acetyltransferase [Stappia aggregata IAM 12614] [Roseibium aggregatum IAM 12614]
MISFRPVTAEDLPMLATWMARPHWRHWWGDPEEELNNIRDMVEGRDTTRPFIFQEGGVDKGYIQVWFVGDQQGSTFAVDYPWLDLLPAEAVGVDLSIAAEEDVSRGLGTRTLQAFVHELREQGHERIIIDPDPANLRAVKAYRKAGFREIEALLGRTGDYLLMELVSKEGVS